MAMSENSQCQRRSSYSSVYEVFRNRVNSNAALRSYELKNIKLKVQDRLFADIYHNKGEGNYCFALKSPLRKQISIPWRGCWPNIPELHSLYGQKESVNGTLKYLVEIRTIKVLKTGSHQHSQFSTILNKEIVNYVKGKYEFLAEKGVASPFYGDKVEVPVLAYQKWQLWDGFFCKINGRRTLDKFIFRR